MSTTTTGIGTVTQPQVAVRPRRRIRSGRVALHGFLIAMSLLWLFPLLWVLYTSLRPISDTIVHGYVTLPQSLTLDNFITGWNAADLPRFFLNTIIVVV